MIINNYQYSQVPHDNCFFKAKILSVRVLYDLNNIFFSPGLVQINSRAEFEDMCVSAIFPSPPLFFLFSPTSQHEVTHVSGHI